MLFITVGQSYHNFSTSVECGVFAPNDWIVAVDFFLASWSFWNISSVMKFACEPVSSNALPRTWCPTSSVTKSEHVPSKVELFLQIDFPDETIKFSSFSSFSKFRQFSELGLVTLPDNEGTLLWLVFDSHWILTEVETLFTVGGGCEPVRPGSGFGRCNSVWCLLWQTRQTLWDGHAAIPCPGRMQL